MGIYKPTFFYVNIPEKKMDTRFNFMLIFACTAVLFFHVSPAYGTLTCSANQYKALVSKCNICNVYDHECKNCKPCSKGYYNSNCGGNNNGTCTACPANHFQNNDTAYKSSCTPYTQCACGFKQTVAPSRTRDRVCAPCGKVVTNGITTYLFNTNAHQASAQGGYTTCHSSSLCAKGHYLHLQSGKCNPRVCKACPLGGFIHVVHGSATTCLPWTTCAAGTRQLSQGTTTTNRVCEACGAGSFSSHANSLTCKSHQTCEKGKYVVAHPTLTSDRQCKYNPAGTFTSTHNQPLQQKRTCPSTVYSVEGDSMTDRVCCKQDEAVSNGKCIPPKVTRYIVIQFKKGVTQGWCKFLNNAGSKGKMENCATYTNNAQKKQCDARKSLMKAIARHFRVCDPAVP